MQSLPVWYVGFREFSYVFHSAADLLFIVFGFLIVGIVARPGWKHHLRWATPSAAACVLTGCERLEMDLHHYLHLGTALSSYFASEILAILATAVSFYSVFMLWRTLRDLSQHLASPDPLAADAMSFNVWPPPPVAPTGKL